MRGGARRFAPPGVDEQPAFEILTQRSVSFRVDLLPIAFPIQLRETLAIQRDVDITGRIAAGATVAHQGGHDQQQRGQDHERGEEPENEHREPLEMAEPRRARSTFTNLSTGPCAGKGSMKVHL